jgi:hypothetical protein
MNIYLRLLACIYTFAAVVHIGNMLGFGELPWAEAPLVWRVGDIGYAILDTVAAVGLFLLKPWGVAAFLVAAVSEILLFTLVPEWFVLKPEHLTMLRGFAAYHLVAIGIYLFLYWRQAKAVEG